MKTKKLKSIVIMLGRPHERNNPKIPMEPNNGTKITFKLELMRELKKTNSALLKARNTLCWKSVKARKVVNKIKNRVNFVSFKKREGAHRSEPKIKITDSNTLTRTIIVKQELMSSSFFDSLGKYLIIPNSRPNLEKPAKRLITETSAATLPTSFGV